MRGGNTVEDHTLFERGPGSDRVLGLDSQSGVERDRDSDNPRAFALGQVLDEHEHYESSRDPSSAPTHSHWLKNLPCRSRTEACWVSKLESAFPGSNRDRIEPTLDAFAAIFCNPWTDASIYDTPH
jgi:hypothetical protein